MQKDFSYKYPHDYIQIIVNIFESKQCQNLLFCFILRITSPNRAKRDWLDLQWINAYLSMFFHAKWKHLSKEYLTLFSSIYIFFVDFCLLLFLYLLYLGILERRIRSFDRFCVFKCKKEKA